MSKAVGETGILVVRPGLTLSGFVMFVPGCRQHKPFVFSDRFDSGGDEPHIAPIQETFWGRYFAKGVRDPSQTCPPPFLRDMFLKMFDVKSGPKLLSFFSFRDPT